MEQVAQGADVFFLLMGAILVFAMHGGFAFLEVGTVRHKNQVNALVKILVDFAISTLIYFLLGYCAGLWRVVLRKMPKRSAADKALTSSNSSSLRRSQPPFRPSSPAVSLSGRGLCPSARRRR